MAFTQLIELDGADEAALHAHVAQWHEDQAGAAPGYLGARVFADANTPGRHIVEVDFSSAEQAKANSDREATAAWAATLRELADGEPTYRDLREVCTTYR